MKVSNASLIAALAFALTALTPVSRAQNDPAPKDQPRSEQPGGGQRERRGQGGAANQLDRVAERLKLSEEQKTKVRPVFQDQMTKLRDLRQDTTLTQEQRRDKVREVREQYMAKMKEVLTAEQFAELKKMQEQAGTRGQRGPRPGAGGGAGNAPSDAKPQ